jgi:methyl coenzyme M reductase subunit D
MASEQGLFLRLICDNSPKSTPNIPNIQENLGPLELEVTKDQYVKAIDCIKDYIALGLDLRRATRQ